MSSLSPDDVLSLTYPGDPSWSTDGRYVGSVLREPDRDTVLFVDPATDERWQYQSPEVEPVTTFAWRPRHTEALVTTGDGRTVLVDPETETTRLLTVGPERDHVFSPDGELVAFYDDGQVRTRELATGATTTFDGPTDDQYAADDRMLAWSPDGRRLAYRCTARETKQVAVVDTVTEEVVWRTAAAAASRSPVWISPDRLVFERVSDHAARRELLTVTPATGTTTVLHEERDTRSGVFLRSAPVVSPDRSQLALSLPLDGWPHVYTLDLQTGTLDQLTAGAFEDTGTVGDAPRWIDDTSLLFSTNRNDPEQRDIYRVDTETGDTQPVVTTAGTNVAPRPSPDGRRLAYCHTDRHHSPELRVRQLEDTDHDTAGTQLTESGVTEWSIEPVAPERVTIETGDGVEVPALLLDPRGVDSAASVTDPLPALVWVHGGPMRQMRDGWHPSRAYSIVYGIHQLLASEGYVGLLVNYRGSIGYGYDFRQSLADDPGREVDQDVHAAGEYLAERDYVDEDAIAVWGLSYGGYATLRVLGTRPETFALGINVAGVADRRRYAAWATDEKRPEAEFRLPTQLGGTRWEAPDAWESVSAVTWMDQYRAPLYNFHGTADGDVHVEQLDLTVDRLLETDANFEAEYYPGENHVFRSKDVWHRTVSKIVDALDSHCRRPQ